MHCTDLTHWLNWQASLHTQPIELGLFRCHQVAQRLNLLSPPFPIITVAGTNGKGSSAALLEAILVAAGYRTGCYTSPHLLRYNERIRIAGQEAEDMQLCQAFNAIETVRETTSLTFFEFATLAAMWLFHQHTVDIAILEVGLGGRLDAVNLFDPTVALVTVIDLDHQQWLGHDRDSIGFEKAGIFRSHRPAICTDLTPPPKLLAHAQHLQTQLFCLGKDFTYQKNTYQTWSWHCHTQHYPQLPLPQLPGDFQIQNAAGVLMAITLLDISVSESAICQGLTTLKLPGRFQMFSGPIPCILDVAHNPLGVKVLKAALHQYPCSGYTHAVVGILKDKDIANILAPLKTEIKTWHIAPLSLPHTARTTASVEDILTHLHALAVQTVYHYDQLTTAYIQARAHSQPGDRIVVFGSFYAVAEILPQVTAC